MYNKILPKLFFIALIIFSITACAKKTVLPLEIDKHQHIGIASFYQPAETHELLSGYLPQNLQMIEKSGFEGLNENFTALLLRSTKHRYVGVDIAKACVATMPKAEHIPAFNYWLNIGACMNVDFLIVPQVIAWTERIGGELSIERPASVTLDFYLLDVANQSFIARSRFDERQQALTDNLLDTGKFFSRGAKWITAQELAKEGMKKAIQEFGL